MAALLFKLGALGVRMVAKPLGDRFKNWVMSHPLAREKAVGLAQRWHVVEVYVGRGEEGKSGKAFIGSMTEERSVELASKIAAEAFIFTVGVTVIVFEHNRKRASELDRKREVALEHAALMDQAKAETAALWETCVAQRAAICELFDKIEHLEKEIVDKTTPPVATRFTWLRFLSFSR